MAPLAYPIDRVWAGNGPASTATFPGGQPAPGALYLDQKNGRVQALVNGSWITASFDSTLTQTFTFTVVARDTNVDGTTNLFVAPWAGTVTTVTYATVTAITGGDTNSRAVTLINLGLTGLGSAAAATLDFVSGVNSVAGVPKAIVVTAVAADKAVVAGDVLQWSSTSPGSGIADPGGVVTITLTRT